MRYSRLLKRLAKHLAYPLHLDAVMALAVLYILGNLLFAITGIETEFESTSLTSVMHWSTVTLFLTLLFYHGLDIVEQTAKGIVAPPKLNLGTMLAQIRDTISEELSFNFSGVNYRLLRQQLMVMLYLGLSAALDNTGHVWFALVVKILFVALLPASLGINAFAANKLHLANPVKLVQFAVPIWPEYLMAMAALLLAYASYQAAISASPLAFQLYLPFSLYFSLVMFRALGAGVHRRNDVFLLDVPRPALQASAPANIENHTELYRMLDTAHELELTGKTVEAVALLRSWTRRLGDWKQFDTVFGYVSAWPDKSIGVQFVSEYLPACIEQRKYMRALELCKWCLQHDAAFCLNDAASVQTLAEQAASREQYRTVCHLIENQRGADPATRIVLLKLASVIAISHLKDEARFQQLQQQIERVSQST